MVFDVILSGDISKKWRIGFLTFPLQCYLWVNKPVSEHNKNDRHKKTCSVVEMASISVHVLEITSHSTHFYWTVQHILIFLSLHFSFKKGKLINTFPRSFQHIFIGMRSRQHISQHIQTPDKPYQPEFSQITLVITLIIKLCTVVSSVFSWAYWDIDWGTKENVSSWRAFNSPSPSAPRSIFFHCCRHDRPSPSVPCAKNQPVLEQRRKATMQQGCQAG